MLKYAALFCLYIIYKKLSCFSIQSTTKLALNVGLERTNSTKKSGDEQQAETSEEDSLQRLARIITFYAFRQNNAF